MTSPHDKPDPHFSFTVVKSCNASSGHGLSGSGSKWMLNKKFHPQKIRVEIEIFELSTTPCQMDHWSTKIWPIRRIRSAGKKTAESEIKSTIYSSTAINPPFGIPPSSIPDETESAELAKTSSRSFVAKGHAAQLRSTAPEWSGTAMWQQFCVI